MKNKAKKSKYIAFVLLAFMLFLIFGSVSVLASSSEQLYDEEGSAMDKLLKSYSAGTMEESFSKDSSGNVHVVSGDDEIKSKKDFYWAGESIEAKLSSVGYDLLMAGMNIDVSGGKVNGAVRAAGNSVQFSKMKVSRNVTIAGKIVRLMDVRFDTGYLAGEKVTFQGTSNCIHAIGNTVVINGVVNGDVSIKADKVIIGPEAEIKGMLKGTAADIQKSESAKINEDELKEETEGSGQNGLLGSLAGGASFLSFAFNLILWLFVFIFLWKPVENAGNIMRKRPGGLAITGGIMVIGVPVASIALFMTIVGIPVAAILLMIYVIMWLISIPFGGAILGRLMMPRASRWLSSLLGVIILSAASILPFVGSIIVIAAAMFTMGYFARSFYENCMKKDSGGTDIMSGGTSGNGVKGGKRYPVNGYDYRSKGFDDDNVNDVNEDNDGNNRY